jgi:hypothetical protein
MLSLPQSRFWKSAKDRPMKHLARIRVIGVALAAALLWAGNVTNAFAEDWQGRHLTSTDFIVGYGSLINSASRNSTATAPIPAIPVRVLASFGYIRTWNHPSSFFFTALGLRKAKPGESGVTINGVLYEAIGGDMPKFDEREQGYTRVEVPASQIEAVSWQRLPESGHIWIYVPVRADGQGAPGEGLPEPDADYPLLQSYIDVVVEGALEYDAEFAREVVDTTDGWNGFWLNDRELARRPLVHDPKAAKVDALLRGTPKSATFFASRAFPEVYGERLRTGAAK